MEHSTRPIQRIVEPKDSASAGVPHLLPCRINHSGDVPGVGDHWRVQKGEDGQKVAHFRGRRLLGSTVALPAGYSGVVMTKPETSSTNETVSGSVFSTAESADAIDVDALPDMPPEGELVVAAEFDELVVWGHDSKADGSVDPYIRSAVEWVQVAEKIHSYQPVSRSTGAPQ